MDGKPEGRFTGDILPCMVAFSKENVSARCILSSNLVLYSAMFLWLFLKLNSDPSPDTELICRKSTSTLRPDIFFAANNLSIFRSISSFPSNEDSSD